MFAAANLRLGAQLAFVPAARSPLAASILLAVVAVVISKPEAVRYMSRSADV
jgi:hypothetical protein